MYKNILALVLILLLVALANPFMLWMPSMVLVGVLSSTTILLFVWAGFILSEQAKDEREESHRSFSGRAAYLSAAAVLLVALLVQSLAHHIDPWIPAALAVMILAKSAARVYTNRYW